MNRLAHCLLGSILLWMAACYPGSTWANAPFHELQLVEQVQLIEELLDHNLGYSDQVKFDDVLLTHTAVEQHYLKQGDLKHYFQLKELNIYIHASSGMLTQASELSQQLLAEAQEMDYTPGIALARFALGDVYLNGDMLSEALKAYQEANRLLLPCQEVDNIKELMMMQLIPLLLRMKAYDETERSLEEMGALYIHYHPHLNPFLYHYFRTFLYTALGQRDEAEHALQQADSLFQQKPSTYYSIYKLFAHAGLERLKGHYQEAARCYLEIGNLARRSGIHLREQKANLLLVEHHKQNRNYREACQIYSLILAERDSLSSHNYSSQVNLLHAIYQADDLHSANDARRREMLLYAVSGAAGILLIALSFIFIYRRRNSRLALTHRQLEEARLVAEKSIQSKSLFLSNMSHEIRTPLNALAGFSAILVESNIDEETRLQCSDIIEQNSELLEKLFGDIVDLSNIELGNMQFQYADEEVVAICHHVIDTEARIKQTAAQVSFSTELPSLTLHTDKARLQQLLINLLINATKFTTQGYIRLTLSLTPTGEALFSVEDTGCGIPLEQQQKIFQRFEKLNEEAQGSGLGLSICQLIIERFGGKIWIDPSYTGGTRFCFTHPLPQTERKEVAS